MALVQSCCHKTVVQRPEGGFIYATNHFTAPELQPYQYQGPDDIFSHRRWETLRSAFEKNLSDPPSFTQKLLRGEYGFLCQYDRSLGFGTLWSSAFGLARGIIYRAEGNPARKPFLKDSRPLFAYK